MNKEIKMAYINLFADELGFTAEEVDRLIIAKQNELKGLISEEGAYFVVAKENGLELPKQPIKNNNKEVKTMSDEEEQAPVSWMDEAASTPPISGDFLNIIFGITYVLKMDDVLVVADGEPQGRPRTFDGQWGKKTKYMFEIRLIAIKIHPDHKAIRDALKVTDEELYNKQKDYIALLRKKDSLDKVYNVGLPKSGWHYLGKFCVDEKLKAGEAFTFVRLGNTKFELAKLTE